MNLKKLAAIAGDFLHTNSAFLTSGAQRARLREALKVDGFDRRRDALIREDELAAPLTATPYARLAETSLALTGIRIDQDAPPMLNLVIGEVRTAGVFAGVHTALTAAARLADILGVGLRIVMLDPTSTDNSRAAAEKAARPIVGSTRLVVVTRETIRAEPYSASDYWLATHSKTAHAVQVACDIGVIDRSRVAYLIQDYEPGFTAWSTESVLAEATYRAGFVPIVNSTPLWMHLNEAGLDVPRELVFAPTFESTRLQQAAALRERTPGARVLFYGRRSKHRNLFALGVSALKAATVELGADAAQTEFYSLGEQHDDVPLGNGAVLRSKGRLAWDEYFRFLATVDVALSLQQSPHPSHPPFDAAISGAHAVTNDFGGGRSALHPRISAVSADTPSLGAALVQAIRNARDAEPAGYLPVADGLLGSDLDDALRRAAVRLAS
ncbi:hypothetical protein [Leifsonia sp. NPDC058248]|uniref:rhamnosyltransferase WsaF family glycosyltransferase n=1 Tax=Leifsonia sp. NPDC058248 TaxID=3346402 RepID=UPI0036DDA4B3